MKIINYMINITNTENRMSIIRKTLVQTSQICTNKCQEIEEITLTTSRLTRLRQQEELLYNIMGKQRQRVKRRFLNIVGNAAKVMFGTLGEDALTRINREFDQLYDDNKILSQAIKNNTKVPIKNDFRFICTRLQKFGGKVKSLSYIINNK